MKCENCKIEADCIGYFLSASFLAIRDKRKFTTIVLYQCPDCKIIYKEEKI
jgi:hypothetical protein